MKDFNGMDILSIATTIAKHLKEQDIEVVIVGGLAVSIYTFNRYQTSDIDMVNTSRNSAQALSAAMAKLGFYKKGRHFHNETTNYFVEFPTAPLNIADETNITPTSIETGTGTVSILEVFDVIRDRLTWVCNNQNDRQSLVQALCLMLNHGKEPHEFADFMRSQTMTEEDFNKQFNLCHTAYLRALEKEAQDMAAIEDIVEDEFINSL